MSVLKVLLAAVVLIVLLIYFGPMVLLYRGQEKIIFPAPAVSVDQLHRLAAAAGATEVTATTTDGITLYGWHLRAAEPGRGVLLYFHGNGETVAFTRPMQRATLAAGWDFVCVSPRGYPGSSGHPIPEGIARDARAIWEMVTGPMGYAPGQVVLHGRSLGGGLAGTLLPHIHPGGLVMESTFASLVRIGKGVFPLYPIRLLLRYRAPTEETARHAAYPVLILHGDQDRVVPVSHGRRLAERFPNAAYVEVAGFGHNDGLFPNAPEALQAWRQYLANRAPPAR